MTPRGPADDDPWALLGLEGHPASRTPPAPDAVAAGLRALEAPEVPGADDGADPAGGAPTTTGLTTAGLTTAGLLPALGALVPAVLARHRRLGLPDDVSRATLADVGRKVGTYGEGIDAEWLLALLRADVVAVGRLQVERVASAHGRALHVPEGDPLDVRAVHDSVVRADALLGAAPITCTSWLLDPWLGRVLPPGSGIVAFASLFRLEAAPAPDPGGAPTSSDREVARFVLRRPLEELLEPGGAPPVDVERWTSLQRLVLERLRSGEHWREPRGTYVGPR